MKNFLKKIKNTLFENENRGTKRLSVMGEEKFSKLSSHKGGELKLHAMSYKRDAVKFAQGHPTNLTASRFGEDKKIITEWIRSIDEITARAQTKKRHERGGRKPVIMEIKEKLLKWIPKCRSRMVHVSQKIISAKTKAMFDKGNVEPAIQDSFVASSSSWI